MMPDEAAVPVNETALEEEEAFLFPDGDGRDSAWWYASRRYDREAIFPSGEVVAWYYQRRALAHRYHFRQAADEFDEHAEDLEEDIEAFSKPARSRDEAAAKALAESAFLGMIDAAARMSRHQAHGKWTRKCWANRLHQDRRSHTPILTLFANKKELAVDDRRTVRASEACSSDVDEE